MSTETSEIPVAAPPEVVQDRWRDLFSGRRLAVSAVLAGGVGLYAMNLFIAAALMPSIVQDLGGSAYYAWAATGFLLAAVISSMLVSRILGAWGAAASYAVGFLVFAAGAVLSALAPTMGLFIAGRVIQGLGGGLLAGLGYAVIRTALPPALWTRAAGLVSAMWGVGTLVGPSVGGLFAELHAWPWAFAALAAVAVVLAIASTRVLPGPDRSADARMSVPYASLVLLTLAAAAFSMSSVVPAGPAVAAALALGAVLLVVFLVVDARSASGVLPKLTYQRRNPLKWVYLTVALICAGVMTENFIPLFGQELASLSPLMAGFLGAALSIGWVGAQLFSVSLPDRTVGAVLRCAPLLLTGGLVLFGVLLHDGADIGRVIGWALALLVAGAGIGLAFPHLGVAAMRSSADAAVGAQAAAALSTTQLIANTIASALGGTFVSFGASALGSAQWMVFGLAALTAVAILTAQGVRRR
ncbi:MFS transporter [Microbacterium resistens]|uniref:MFS transporter n=1 Tax=Microbacterium resistens TaxID=156977 RepID=UPI000AB70DBA|nr:MFS transporter [Microbacterium resistens]